MKWGTAEPQTSFTTRDIPLRQGALSAAIDSSAFERLLSSAPTTRSRALGLSTGLPHAHDWLNVIPSPSLGLHLQDREFRSCLCYWLGVPLHNDQFTCPECRCVADPFGDHQVGCGAIATVSVVTTPLETWSSRPLNLPLWAPPLKLQALLQSLVLALRTSFSPIGPTAVQPLSTSTSSLLSSSSHCQ